MRGVWIISGWRMAFAAEVGKPLTAFLQALAIDPGAIGRFTQVSAMNKSGDAGMRLRTQWVGRACDVPDYRTAIFRYCKAS
jgi:hypothetical protein